MSSFIAAILKATVGLLVNKGRNVAAERLKKGDVTNELLHNIIVCEFDDVKSKLDGMAEKDLSASINFFKEGLVYLKAVKPNEEDGKVMQQREDRAATPLQKGAGSSSTNVKTVSLAEEMRSLQPTDRDNSSAGALNDAKDRFKQAREKATEAFYNEALSTSDRILAMQYRILATILEKVDRLNDALEACRFFLEELHSMPEVKKNIDVHLKQGFKSKFNKAKREGTIASVCRINRVIFHITVILGEDDDISLWPCIDRGEDKVDPLRDVRITETIKKEDPQYFLLKTWPFCQEGEETMTFKDWFITTNTKRQLMIVATDGNSEFSFLKVFDHNGNPLQSLCLKLPVLVTASNVFSSQTIRGIASDEAKNVFLLVVKLDRDNHFKKSSVAVFDHQANFTHEFDVNRGSCGSSIAVSDDNKVFVSTKETEMKECVQVYSLEGKLLNIIQNNSLRAGTVAAITYMDSKSGKFMVLSYHMALKPPHYFYPFCEQGNVTSESRYYVVSGLISHIYNHDPKPKFHWDELSLFNKNGKLVRKIKLKLSAMTDSDATAAFTVFPQGLLAMLATDKTTGKRMIVIL